MSIGGQVAGVMGYKVIAYHAGTGLTFSRTVESIKSVRVSKVENAPGEVVIDYRDGHEVIKFPSTLTIENSRGAVKISEDHKWVKEARDGSADSSMGWAFFCKNYAPQLLEGGAGADKAADRIKMLIHTLDKFKRKDRGLHTTPTEVWIEELVGYQLSADGLMLSLDFVTDQNIKRTLPVPIRQVTVELIGGMKSTCLFWCQETNRFQVQTRSIG